MNWRLGRLLSIAALGCALSHATPVGVLGLRNTGTDLNNSPLGAPNIPFPWTLLTDPNYGVSGGGALLAKTAYIATSYVSEVPLNARWITGTDVAGNIVTTSSTVFTYTYTLDLTNFIVPTLAIAGQFAADNCGEIFVNGVTTGINTGGPANNTCTPSSSNFSTLHAFALNSASGGGFIAGLNTIQFLVYNDGGGTGLLVNFTEGFAAQTPEPATFATLGLSMLALGLMGRRRAAIRR